MRNSLAAAVFAIGAVGACSSACVDIVGANLDNKYVEREEKRFTTHGKPEVALSTFDGSIEIRSWDKAEVEVIVEKRGADKSAISEIEILSEQSGNRISVDARIPESHRFGVHFGRSPSAKLIVTLPPSSDVLAKSGDGSVDIDGVTGRVELRSGDGSIRARQLAGDVTVHTGDGSIALDGKFSTLNAHSGDGSITIHAAAGSSAGGDWQVTTGDGSVTLEIPDGFNGELDAHTGDGRVHVNDVVVSNVLGELERNTVRGRLGSGGHAVRVRTGDGSIILRKS
jgi:DUF4097 and DUF4098 domain-containing protein YvlB